MIFRANEEDDDDSEFGDVTSLVGMDTRNEITARAFSDIAGYGEVPILSPISSAGLLGNAIRTRERGHSLSVDRTPELLRLAEPRSTSLRLKKYHKDTPK